MTRRDSRFRIIISLLLLVFFFSSCGNSPKHQNSSPSTAHKNPKHGTAKIIEQINDQQFTSSGVGSADEISEENPEENYEEDTVVLTDDRKAKIKQIINLSDQEKFDKIIRNSLGGRIECNSVDRSFILNLEGGEEAKMDKRVLTMLCLFSTNHRYIKVRLISGFEDKQSARVNDEDQSDRYNSAHYQGQAMDILAADNVADLSWQNGSDIMLKKIAKDKIKELIAEILFVGLSSDNYYRPTQLIIQEEEDVIPHLDVRDQLYGDGTPGSSERSIREGSHMGFSFDHKYSGKIHIGY